MEINGINVSNLIVEKVNEKLKEVYFDKKLVIKEDGKVWQEVLKFEFGYKDDFIFEFFLILNE